MDCSFALRRTAGQACKRASSAIEVSNCRTCIQPIRSLCRKKEKCVEICKEPNFIFLRCGQEEIRFSALSVFLSQDFKKYKTQRENAENQRVS